MFSGTAHTSSPGAPGIWPGGSLACEGRVLCLLAPRSPRAERKVPHLPVLGASAQGHPLLGGGAGARWLTVLFFPFLQTSIETL